MAAGTSALGRIRRIVSFDRKDEVRLVPIPELGIGREFLDGGANSTNVSVGPRRQSHYSRDISLSFQILVLPPHRRSRSAEGRAITLKAEPSRSPTASTLLGHSTRPKVRPTPRSAARLLGRSHHSRARSAATRSPAPSKIARPDTGALADTSEHLRSDLLAIMKART